MPTNDFHERFSAELIEENNLNSNCDVKCLYTNKINNETLKRADGFLTYQNTHFKYPVRCKHQKTIILTMENVEHPGFDITVDTRPTSDITAGYYNHHEYDLFKPPEKKSRKKKNSKKKFLKRKHQLRLLLFQIVDLK